MKRRHAKAITLIILILLLICMTITGLLIVLRPTTHKLIKAIENEDVVTVQRLLENGVDPNKLTATPGWFWSLIEYAPQRPLSTACKTGNLEIVTLLISYGATAEFQEGTDWSPLKETLFYFHEDDVEIVKLLLKNGAITHEYEKLLVFDAAAMHPKVYDPTKANGTVWKGDYDEETAKGITEIVKLLLEQNPIDMSGADGGALLMLAARRGNLALTEYLLAEGCPTDYQNENGETAYDIAWKHGYNEIAKILKP